MNGAARTHDQAGKIPEAARADTAAAQLVRARLRIALDATTRPSPR